jgi:hypothetical protein
MSTFVHTSALSVDEHDRLASLLAGLPAGERWWVEHMQGALLCTLGLLDPPDAAYARAADRRFTDPVDARRRALALLAQLDRDLRLQQHAKRR